MTSRTTVAALAFCLCAAAHAQETVPDAEVTLTPPLTTEELLTSSNLHYPSIIRSLAARRDALAQTLEVEGAFDIVFESEGFSRASGFYDGTSIETTVRQPFRRLGGGLYAGYKLSNGDFPTYEDEAFTNTGGAVKIGALFSLMRDRDIDPRRFALTDAQLNFERAELDVLLTRIGVQQQALQAYWRWVMMGRQLQVFEGLLQLGVDRQSALEEQNRRGALARIVLTENAQNITRRRQLVAAAERDLAMAANRLSVFYRGSNGEPIVPSKDRIPPLASRVSEVRPDPIDDRQALIDALATRPELALLRNAIELETNRAQLQRNDLKPRLDLNVELQQPLGAIDEGGPSRDTTDTIVGVTFSVPLQRREAKGRLQRTQARLDAQRAEQQLREDQIRIEIRNLIVDLRAAQELMTLAATEVEQSEILAQAEMRRFESGASDFFLVNVREVAVADAQVKLLSAEFNTRIARANFDAATVNTTRLGIDERLPRLP